MTLTLVRNTRRAIEDGDKRDPLRFHQLLPGYAPTVLREVPSLATRLGLGEVWVKDESERLGLPSFKILGASYAISRRLRRLAIDQAGVQLDDWTDLLDVSNGIEALRPLTLAAATDGNHGRAVARVARILGLHAHIFVPYGTTMSRIEGIREEHADVTVVMGTYDDAVRQAADFDDERCLVISDTSWPGYEEVPRWIIDGYSTIFFEVDEQLHRANRGPPDAVVVQIGVGALAAAAVRHFRHPMSTLGPTLVGVEPSRAACVLESIRAGRLTTIPGSLDSIMVGLNCGTPSSVAWPYVSRGIDAFVAIDDEYAREAMRILAGEGVTSGETGAAGLGGLLALDAEDRMKDVLGNSRPMRETRVLIISTEGATDRRAYEEIVSGEAME
jgi:diaminopropionate ammonia-lyase